MFMVYSRIMRRNMTKKREFRANKHFGEPGLRNQTKMLKIIKITRLLFVI